MYQFKVTEVSCLSAECYFGLRGLLTT